jgi:hypothetical protein
MWRTLILGLLSQPSGLVGFEDFGRVLDTSRWQDFGPYELVTRVLGKP